MGEWVVGTTIGDYIGATIGGAGAVRHGEGGAGIVVVVSYLSRVAVVLGLDYLRYRCSSTVSVSVLMQCLHPYQPLFRIIILLVLAVVVGLLALLLLVPVLLVLLLL